MWVGVVYHICSTKNGEENKKNWIVKAWFLLLLWAFRQLSQNSGHHPKWMAEKTKKYCRSNVLSYTYNITCRNKQPCSNLLTNMKSKSIRIVFLPFMSMRKAWYITKSAIDSERVRTTTDMTTIVVLYDGQQQQQQKYNFITSIFTCGIFNYVQCAIVHCIYAWYVNSICNGIAFTTKDHFEY